MATQEGNRCGVEGEVLLSEFECRCLLKQLCNCHEAVSQAIAGTAGARERAPWLGPVCDALRAAEAEISKAGQLVVADRAVAAACFRCGKGSPPNG